MFKSFMGWWTADHIQAIKKGVVMGAGIAVYVLPHGSFMGQIAALLAVGGLSDSTVSSIWKLLQDKAT